MKKLCVLAVSTLFVSGAALACDDLKMTGDYDGGVPHSHASVAPDTDKTGSVADKTPMTFQSKTKPGAKQKTQGKPVPQGVSVSKTAAN